MEGEKQLSVFIATPTTWGGISPWYFSSIISTLIYLWKHKIGGNIATAVSSWVSYARNDLAKRFLGGNYEYLMFIDSDMVF